MIHHPRPVTLRGAPWSRWAGLRASRSQWEQGGEEGEGDPLHPKSSANVKWAKQSERRRRGGNDGVSLRLTSASSGLLSERIRLVTCQGSLPPVMMFHNISSVQREHQKSSLFISVSNHVLGSRHTRGFTESPKILNSCLGRMKSASSRIRVCNVTVR